MVDIHSIKTNECPICGNSVIASECVEIEFGSDKIRQHCNRTRWETRKFGCGLEIRFCPNFDREEKHGRCINDLSLRERDEKRKLALSNLIEEIDKLNCDDEYKKKISERLNYIC